MISRLSEKPCKAKGKKDAKSLRQEAYHYTSCERLLWTASNWAGERASERWSSRDEAPWINLESCSGLALGEHTEVCSFFWGPSDDTQIWAPPKSLRTGMAIFWHYLEVGWGQHRVWSRQVSIASWWQWLKSCRQHVTWFSSEWCV